MGEWFFGSMEFLAGGEYTPIQSVSAGTETPIHVTVIHSPDLFSFVGETDRDTLDSVSDIKTQH